MHRSSVNIPNLILNPIDNSEIDNKYELVKQTLSKQSHVKIIKTKTKMIVRCNETLSDINFYFM